MDETVVDQYVFRGVEYVVSMGVDTSTLTVEVEDRLTGDQWRGSFDAACTYVFQVRSEIFALGVQSSSDKPNISLSLRISVRY